MITLKQYMGEAGALVGDRSIGSDTLYDVLAALAKGAGALSGRQDIIATGILAGVVLNTPHKLTNLRTSISTCGSAGNTVVQVHKNGVSQGELTTANDDADGTKKSLDMDVDCVAGDLIELVCSTAPTAGAFLTASAYLEAVKVE